jgi:hypothetical protein
VQEALRAEVRALRTGDPDLAARARPRRERTLLAPPGHPGVDQRAVALRAGLRAHAEPERLDEHVGRLGHAQHGLGAGGGLQVDHDRRPAPP